MAAAGKEKAEVQARIIYWGIAGSGKSTSLHKLHGALKPEHRGQLRIMPTRLDPTVTYELLPIEVGEVAGVRTRFEIIAVPGGPEHAATRKQLLDRVDGLVFVVDSQKQQLDENLASFDELRKALESYGRSVTDIPLILQFNKSDLADLDALEQLHRKLDLPGAAVVESMAPKARGVLQVLTSICKQVIRVQRERSAAPATGPGVAPGPVAQPRPTAARTPPRAAAGPVREATPTRAAPPPNVEPASPPATLRMEDAILEEAGHPDADQIATTTLDAQATLDASWDQASQGALDAPTALRGGSELSIASVGKATRVGERALRLPLILADGTGTTLRVVLTLELDVTPGDREG